MPNPELDALAAEAHRRGVTYGKLVAELSWSEKKEIVRRYLAEHKKSRRKKAK